MSIWNKNPRVWFSPSISILSRYTTTIYTEYCILVKAHEDAGNHTFSSTVQYKHFRSAWYVFLALLDIDYSRGFQYTKCGPYPQTLVMDATGLSFRRELGFWGSNTIMDVSKDRVPKGRQLYLVSMYVYLDTFVCVNIQFLKESAHQ